MLAAYQRKLAREPEELQQRVTLHTSDMCSYELPHKGEFDLIILPFNSISHLYEIEQQLGAFKNAYEHLVHGGACQNGTVPFCFGWLELAKEDLDNLVKLPDLPDAWSYIHQDDGLPKALLLEYFDGAERMTIDNITVKIADSAVRALYQVHASYVLHNDIHGRNVLVLPGGRVVWVDFDSTDTVDKSTEDRPIRRQELLEELVQSWDIFYNWMVSNSTPQEHSLPLMH